MKPILILSAVLLSACAGDAARDVKPQLSTLAGSEWGRPDLGDAFVQFQGEGKLIGHGGCNRFFGSYTQDGSSVEIGPLGSTKMMCPPAQMDIENTIMSALQDTASVDATHLVLILNDKDGTPLLELQRRDWD